MTTQFTIGAVGGGGVNLNAGVSTGGASPGLAARIRERLTVEFGPEWADRLAQLRRRRAAWREQGADVPALTDAMLRSSGWLA